MMFTQRVLCVYAPTKVLVQPRKQYRVHVRLVILWVLTNTTRKYNTNAPELCDSFALRATGEMQTWPHNKSKCCSTQALQRVPNHVATEYLQGVGKTVRTPWRRTRRNRERVIHTSD